MKATSYKLLRVSLSAFVIIVGVVFLLPQHAYASLFAVQPVDDTTESAQTYFRQQLPAGLTQSLNSFTVTYKSAYTIRGQVEDVTANILYQADSDDTSATNTKESHTFYFTSGYNNVTLDPTHTYYIRVSTLFLANTFQVYGTTANYTGCQKGTGNPVIWSACSTLVSLAYSANSGSSLSFGVPLQYNTPDSNRPVGKDFSDFQIQVSQVPATSTPLTLTVTTFLGSNSITLAASSTDVTFYSNYLVPKTYLLLSNSSSTPTYYSATARLTYQNSGSLIASITTYFGIVSNDSTYTFGNFLTPNGYIAPDDISTSTTASLSTCAIFNSNNVASLIARGLCNAVAFMIVPPTSLLDHLQTIPDAYSQKYPFIYVSQIKSAYESLDYTSPHYVDPTTDPEYRTYSSVTASSSVFNFTILTIPTNASSTPTYMQTWVPLTRKFILYSLYVAFVYGVYISVHDAVKRMGTGGSK